MGRRKEEPGITLVELLVVVSLLTLMSAVAIPVFHQTGTWTLRAAATELAVRIREARQQAIADGQNCYVIFYMANGMVKLESSQGSEWVKLPQGITFAANNFPLVVDGRPTLYFRYTGAPNRGGHVALKNQRGNKLYVIVTPVTGRVRTDSSPPQ
jgi:Tfp pilus assembly protein FimT